MCGFSTSVSLPQRSWLGKQLSELGWPLGQSSQAPDSTFGHTEAGGRRELLAEGQPGGDARCPRLWAPSVTNGNKKSFKVSGVSFLCPLDYCSGHTSGDICLSTPGPLLSERIHLTLHPKETESSEEPW